MICVMLKMLHVFSIIMDVVNFLCPSIDKEFPNNFLLLPLICSLCLAAFFFLLQYLVGYGFDFSVKEAYVFSPS